jgi:hypothetical protein
MGVGARGAGSQEAGRWTHVEMSHQNGVHSLVFLVIRDFSPFSILGQAS